MSKSNLELFNRRAKRVRYKLRQCNRGERPRLSVFISNRGIYAQVIDDKQGVTLTAASTVDKEFPSDIPRASNVAAAQAVGQLLGKKAMDLNITKIVLDRGGYSYNGAKIQALADAVRKAGISF